MPLFRVKLIRHDTRFRNSFLRCIGIYGRTQSTIRMWEFEAKDEVEVRKFYNEAKERNLPHVRGFELCSIEEIN